MCRALPIVRGRKDSSPCRRTTLQREARPTRRSQGTSKRLRVRADRPPRVGARLRYARPSARRLYRSRSTFFDTMGRRRHNRHDQLRARVGRHERPHLCHSNETRGSTMQRESHVARLNESKTPRKIETAAPTKKVRSRPRRSEASKKASGRTMAKNAPYDPWLAKNGLAITYAFLSATPP